MIPPFPNNSLLPLLYLSHILLNLCSKCSFIYIRRVENKISCHNSSTRRLLAKKKKKNGFNFLIFPPPQSINILAKKRKYNATVLYQMCVPDP